MSSTVFRACEGQNEAEEFAAVHHARREVDGVELGLNMEEFPSVDEISHEIEASDCRDWIVAEVDGKVAGYGHTLHHSSEHDGRHCYLHLGWVTPERRNMGIGTELIHLLETRCCQKAIENGHQSQFELGANASSTEESAVRLLQNSGYSVLYTIIAMERPLDLAVTVSPMPEGYELRIAQPEHHRAIWQMIGDAYFDSSESGHGNQVAPESSYRSYFQSSWADPSLWFVAWRGSRIAGVVLCRMINGTAEVYEVSVSHVHRRGGLARALLTRGLEEIAAREPTQVKIWTRKEFPTQAWRLYESVGFQTVKEFPRWRKAAPPPHQPSHTKQ